MAVSAKLRHYPGSRVMVEGNASAIRNLRPNPAHPVGAQAALISHHVRHRLGRRLVTPAGGSAYALDKPLIDSPEIARINSYMDAGNIGCRDSGRKDLWALAAIADINAARE
jgi:hypothetical protein